MISSFSSLSAHEQILFYLSVCPSIRSNHDCVRSQRAMNSVCIENELYRSTGSGTSHINQTGILRSWAHGKSDAPKNSVAPIRYLAYKSNRYTGVLSTWHIRFTPNLIFRLFNIIFFVS